jgi:hypothetical protein
MILAVLLTMIQAPTATAGDTALTVQGILVAVPAAGGRAATWAVQLLQPITLGRVKTNVLELQGNPRAWTRWADRYVEARGRVVVDPGAGQLVARLEGARVNPAKPPGLVERRVRLSHSQQAVVTLAVVPNVIRAPVPDAPAAARPVVLYTISNVGMTDLEFYFPNTKAVCVTVAPRGGPLWEDPTELRQQAGSAVTIRMGVMFRQLLPLPAEATPVPGRHEVRASLCGVSDYEVTTELWVIAP